MKIYHKSALHIFSLKFFNFEIKLLILAYVLIEVLTGLKLLNKIRLEIFEICHIELIFSITHFAQVNTASKSRRKKVLDVFPTILG